MTSLHYITSFLAAGTVAVAAEPEINVGIYSDITLGAADINKSVLANHAHDPDKDLTVQGVEITTQVILNEYLSGWATYNSFLDEDDNVEGEWENVFGTLTLLDSDLAINVGRVYNYTTRENNLHIHSWDFVNASLLTTRFNGEEGLLTESVQVAWKLPLQHESTLSFSYGDAVAHDHAHGEDDHGGDHHGGDDDDDDDDHGGDHEEEIHGEEAYLVDDVVSVSIRGTFLKDDFNQFHYLAHYSQGTNGYGLDTAVYGGGLEYMWRENGQEEGGKFYAIGAEVANRSVDYASEDGDLTGNEDELGYALNARYGFGNKWVAGARYEHVEGTSVIEENPEIDRISLALTKGFTVSDQISGHVRLQYDYSDHSEAGDSNAGWLQFQFQFGSPNL